MANEIDLMRKLTLFTKLARAGMPGRRRAEDPCRIAHEIGREMQRQPLSRERLLVIIGRYPGGVRQKVIADQVGINQSSASELINKLETTGYIERTIDPDDKRATLLFLTEKGKTRAAEVENERNEIFREAFQVLTDKEKETLSKILDKLLKG